MAATSKASRLRTAIDAGEIEVYYQPQVAARSAHVVAVEALARWRHPDHGLLAPPAFMNDSGPEAISELGDFVLTRACEDAARWRGVSVSVNVSPVQFRDATFAERVLATARGAAMPLERLELEILEDCWFTDVRSARLALGRMRRMGVRIALDDFGSGYSSLSVLFDLPLDKIKLDRTFASHPDSGAPSPKVPEIVALARAIGLQVTAEGVETDAQRRFMQAAGCDFLQGYLFQRPAPAAAIDALLGV